MKGTFFSYFSRDRLSWLFNWSGNVGPPEKQYSANNLGPFYLAGPKTKTAIKHIIPKNIVILFLPILASCQSEPKNPSSFEYFKWHNENYQWGTDKKGNELSIDECIIKTGNANKETISNSDVFLDECLKIRKLKKRKNLINLMCT